MRRAAGHISNWDNTTASKTSTPRTLQEARHRPARLGPERRHTIGQEPLAALIGPRYSEVVPLPFRTFALACGVLVATVSMVAAQDRDSARAQVEFGISVAQRGLWQEALFRWERASEIDPGYAAAWNNLGIAYEHEGQFEKAREAYEKALDLDPDNINIQQNYDLFREINDRIQSSR